MRQPKSRSSEEELLEELESLVPQVSDHSEELDYQLMMAEIVDHIQDTCPVLRQSAALRKLVAPFGDAYFFYNQAGDFCLLTDFLEEGQEKGKQEVASS